jgi:lipoate-protein ligase B
MIAVDLGTLDYGTALSLQNTIHELRVESYIEDTVLFVEHAPVLTMGKSGGDDDLLLTEKELNSRGISLYHLNRGGKITCHYPGQLVVYPIMDLQRFENNVPGYVTDLEEVIIQTLADFGVEGDRIAQHRGVFVGRDKIAAIGIEIRGGVTMHGISLNVFEDTRLYDHFIPCGIKDKGIAFLERCCPHTISLSMNAVVTSFLYHFSDIFQDSLRYILERDIFEKLFLHSGDQQASMPGRARTL